MLTESPTDPGRCVRLYLYLPPVLVVREYVLVCMTVYPGENADEVSVRTRVSSSRDGFRRGYGNEKRRRARPLLRRRPARRAMPLMDTEREALMHACLAARIKARRKRDYARADELRNELRGLGVLVDDKVGYPLPTRHSRHIARSSIWSARVGVIRTRAPKTVAPIPSLRRKPTWSSESHPPVRRHPVPSWQR